MQRLWQAGYHVITEHGRGSESTNQSLLSPELVYVTKSRTHNKPQ